jgi:transcriptional regulator with XRE-family HTH domain
MVFEIMPSKKPVEADKQTRAIGHSLAQIRRERGLTQVELAKKLAISQSRLSQYERGVLRLHGKLIVELAELLAVTTDELLGFTGVRKEAFAVQRRFLRRLQEIDKLSSRDQSALLRTIEAFLSGRLKRSA